VTHPDGTRYRTPPASSQFGKEEKVRETGATGPEGDQENATANTSNEMSPAGTPSSSEPKPPQTPPVAQQCKCQRSGGAQWAATIIEGIGLVVLIVYTYFTYGQWAANKTAADAAASAAATAARQLELSERPWVSAKVAMVKPLTFTSRGGDLGLSILFVSTGHSVATDTLVRAKLVPGELERLYSGKEAEWCRTLEHRELYGKGIIRTVGNLGGSVLFPGDQGQQEETANITAEEITTALKATPLPGRIMLMLLVCIDYRFTFSTEHHHTWYVFLLGTPVAPEVPAVSTWMVYFVPEGTPQGVTLVPWLSGNVAD